MYSLVVQLLAMVVVVHTASIVAHTRHKKLASSCQLQPTNYDYQDTQNQTSQSNLDNCSLHNIGTTSNAGQYMDCVTPALLTDGQYGADTYGSTDHYYIAQHGDSYQILFTFPTIKVVSYIMLYYYSNITGDQSLPIVSVYIVNDDFNVWDSPTTSWIDEVGPSNLPPTQAGLKQERITVKSASRKWLLRFRQLEHQFYLSEVAFFSCPPVTDPPTTEEPAGTTIQTQTMATSTSAIHHKPPPDTQPEPSAHTHTTSTRTTTNIVTHKQLSQQSDLLPWLLMGVMTTLFCALLATNVICCTVCLLKKQRKGRYQLKRNPSYASSPRTLNARNAGFENHIYDFIPTT